MGRRETKLQRVSIRLLVLAVTLFGGRCFVNYCGQRPGVPTQTAWLANEFRGSNQQRRVRSTKAAPRSRYPTEIGPFTLLEDVDHLLILPQEDYQYGNFIVSSPMPLGPMHPRPVTPWYSHLLKAFQNTFTTGVWRIKAHVKGFGRGLDGLYIDDALSPNTSPDLSTWLKLFSPVEEVPSVSFASKVWDFLAKTELSAAITGALLGSSTTALYALAAYKRGHISGRVCCQQVLAGLTSGAASGYAVAVLRQLLELRLRGFGDIIYVAGAVIASWSCWSSIKAAKSCGSEAEKVACSVELYSGAFAGVLCLIELLGGAATKGLTVGPIGLSAFAVGLLVPYCIRQVAAS